MLLSFTTPSEAQVSTQVTSSDAKAQKQATTKTSFLDLLSSVNLSIDEVTQEESLTQAKPQTLSQLLATGENATATQKQVPLNNNEIDVFAQLSQLVQPEESASTKSSSLTLGDLLKNQTTPQNLNLSDVEMKGILDDAKKYLNSKIDFSAMISTKNRPKSLQGIMQYAQSLEIDLENIKVETFSTKGTKATAEGILPSSEKLPDSQKITLTPNEVKPQKNISTQEGFGVQDSLKNTQTQLKEQSLQPNSLAAMIAQKKPERSQQLSSVVKVPSSEESSHEKHSIPVTTQSEESLNTKETFSQKIASSEGIATTLKVPQANNKKSTTEGESLSKNKGLGEQKDGKLTTPLAALLQGEQSGEFAEYNTSSQEEQTTSEVGHTDTTALNKNQSLDLKINEAKQMVKYLSQDVKTAIENYKAPFTRVKVQLNPQNLGSVELTVVQRGDNLHINLSSNNSAINTLALHMNDLKGQLQNNGIQNATLNFSSSSEHANTNSGSSAQQQQQQRQQAQEAYSYYDINEEHEEILSSLEIVVPYYA